MTIFNKVIITITTLFLLIMIIKSDSLSDNRLYGSPGFEFVPATGVNVSLNVIVNDEPSANSYTYNYTITVHPNSVQDFAMLRIEYRGEIPTPVPPKGWRGGLSRKVFIRNGQEKIKELFTPNNMYFISWYKVLSKTPTLSPGSSQNNLIIKDCSLPGIVNYYARGFVLPVRFKAGEADSSLIPPEIKDYYQNSVNGKTLGPVDPPATPFYGVAFSDTIIGYVTESGTLGWISDPAVVTSINANLTTAKGKIGTDNPGAIATLDTILTDLETQHGTSVNDEAYFLIKFNVMYLKDRL